MNRTYLLAGIIGIAALVSLASVAQAKNYCINDLNVPSYVLVGRGFHIPPKGQCKPWSGFTPQNGEDSPTTGTGCRSSDGSHFNLTLTTSFPYAGGDFEIDSITLALPGNTGVSSYSFFEGGVAIQVGTFPVTGGVCGKMPIPAASPGNAAAQAGTVGGGLN
jgi:hypothetical protein